MSNSALRQLIAEAADAVTTAYYTEDQVQSRVAAWQQKAPTPTLAEQATFLLAETRAYQEELLFAVLSAWQADQTDNEHPNASGQAE